MPWRWQVALGREELLPYLLPRVMTCSPSNCVLKWIGSHQQTGKGFQHAGQKATEVGQAGRQAGFYRTRTLWSRDGLHKFTLDLTWLGQEQEAERRQGRGSVAHYPLCSTCPIIGRGCVSPASMQGTEAGTDGCWGLSLMEQVGQTLIR